MDYEVVDDSLREPRRYHRGRPTPQYVMDLLAGKTLRLPKVNTSNVTKQVRHYGFRARRHLTDDGNGYIVWLEHVEP